MSQETNELVGELARHLEPVRPIPPLGVVGAAVGALALAVSILALGFWGVDEAAVTPAGRLGYVGLSAALLLFAAGGVTAALGSSVPGRDAVWRAGVGLVLLSTLALGATWLGLLAGGSEVGIADRLWMRLAAACVGFASLLGLVPALVLAAFVAGAFPRRPGLSIALGTAGLVALGSASVRLSCAADDLLHVGVAHVVAPLAAGALLGALIWLARHFLRRAAD